MAHWPYEEDVLNAIATRENYFCLWCGRNFRMRMVAAIAVPAISGSDVYEPATFGVIAGRLRRCARTFVDSEYFDGGRPGSMIRGRRHEDITRLTFADGSFDIVITSELLEHVVNPWQGFAEVRRVLRVGGRHIFTIPYTPGRRTRSRAGLAKVYHADPIRREGIVVCTDFGDDLPRLLDDHGFRTRVHEFPTGSPVARVYDSQAV